MRGLLIDHPAAAAAASDADEAATDPDALASPPPLRLYAVRWWVLGLFSLFAFLQGLMWALPGPISAAYMQLFGVDVLTIQLLINYGPIFYLPFSIPLMLLMDSPNGIRRSTVLGVALIFVGQALRMLARDSSALSLTLLHLSFILNAIAGPVAMGAVGKISEEFFPADFRATSTALMSEANLFGGAAAQLVGPLFLRTVDMAHLEAYNIFLMVPSCFLMLAVLVYFPSHPPTPPSVSAASLRDNESKMDLRAFYSALYSLMTSPNFALLACAYGLTTGMFGSWATVLSLNLSGCDAMWVGWLSFSCSAAGAAGGILLGRVVDKMRNLKRVVVALLVSAGACFALFALLCAGALGSVVVCDADGEPGPGLWILFVFGVLGGLSLNSTIPVFYELSLELTHPLPEATAVTMLTELNNVGCLIFLVIPATWTGINFLFAAVVFASGAAIACLLKEASLRFDVDAAAHSEKLASDDAHHKKSLLLN